MSLKDEYDFRVCLINFETGCLSALTLFSCCFDFMMRMNFAVIYPFNATLSKSSISFI